MNCVLILFQGFQKYEEEFDPYSMVLYPDRVRSFRCTANRSQLLLTKM